MTLTVRAAYARAQNAPIAVDSFSLDGPREREVLIEIRAAGLCHSDMSFFDGSPRLVRLPDRPRHEGAGVVLECGPGVSSLRPGDHVIPVAIPECGTCPACRSRKTNLCDRYFEPDDPAALCTRRPSDARLLRTRNLLADDRRARDSFQVTPIRSDAPLAVVCCLGCAGATGIGAAVFTARMESGTSAVIFGLGGIGLNVVEGARMSGASTIVGVVINPDKEAAARAAGVTHFLDPGAIAKDENLVGLIRELTGGGADYSFECVGNAAVLRQAVECTRIGWGTTVTLGILPGGEEIALRPRSIQEGRRLIGSYLGNVKTIFELPQLVDWYMDGRISLYGPTSHRMSLDEIGHGFALLASGEARRVVITP